MQAVVSNKVTKGREKQMSMWTTYQISVDDAHRADICDYIKNGAGDGFEFCELTGGDGRRRVYV